MKNLFLVLCAVASLGASADFSGQATITNDYIWRGISQGDGSALQVGVDYNHNSGFYAGAWTSDVNFGDAERELDFYAGYSYPLIENHVNIDVGYIDYKYDESSYDFEEVYGEIEFVDVGLTLFYAQTQDEIEDEFASATLNVPFIDFVEIDIIYNYFEEDEETTLVSISKDLGNGFSFSVLTGEDFITKEDFVATSITYSL